MIILEKHLQSVGNIQSYISKAATGLQRASYLHRAIRLNHCTKCALSQEGGGDIYIYKIKYNFFYKKYFLLETF